MQNENEKNCEDMKSHKTKLLTTSKGLQRLGYSILYTRICLSVHFFGRENEREKKLQNLKLYPFKNIQRSIRVKREMRERERER